MIGENNQFTDAFLGTSGDLDGRIRRRKMAARYSFANFRYGDLIVSQKIASGGTEGSSGGGAATGATGDENKMFWNGEYFEYFIKGAGQTLFVPLQGTTGLDMAMDLTSTEGWELHTGRGAHSKNAYVIGTDAAFFLEVTLVAADTSGANPLVIGFRKQGANNATYTSYSDYASIGLIGTSNPNLLKIDTNIGSAGHVATDTTQTLADATQITLRVDVSAAGVTTFKINGAAPTTTAAYTFTSALTVQPYMTFLHAADICNTMEILQWECGFLV